MVRHGGNSAGSYLTDPTYPIPFHYAVIILFENVPVHQLSWLSLWFFKKNLAVTHVLSVQADWLLWWYLLYVLMAALLTPAYIPVYSSNYKTKLYQHFILTSNVLIKTFAFAGDVRYQTRFIKNCFSLYCHPLNWAPWVYETVWTVLQSLPNLHTHLLHAQQAVGCVWTLSPPSRVAYSQRLSMVRYTIGTATEFDPRGTRTQSYPAPPSW